MIIGYVRVSTVHQDADKQELELYRYAKNINISIDKIESFKISSRKSREDRGVTKLIEKLNQGDTIIFTELSRLGRSTVETISILNDIANKGISIHLIKQGMVIDPSKPQDPYQKALLQSLAVYAELERDILSVRVKESLKSAKEQGKTLGRPKGSTGKSKLDKYIDEIKHQLSLGVSKARISKNLNVSRPTLDNFIKSRGLQ